MAESSLKSIFGLWAKLEKVLSRSASSSGPSTVPILTKLNDMVYNVYSPSPPYKTTVEVLFFHGLQFNHCKDAHFTTWMSQDNSHLWLQTWLAQEFPQARILTISYDASVKRTHEVGRLDMYCTGENLVHSLTSNSVQVGQAGCPVVLVGHCLGGLVMKELCLSAEWMLTLGRKSLDRIGVERIDNLLLNLRGMFFYGTPHNGSLLGDKLEDCIKGPLLEEIETFKASRARRNEEFRKLRSGYGWVTCGIAESNDTFVESLERYIHVVPEASARLDMDAYYTAHGDHYTICKPDGKSNSAFQNLSGFLRQIRENVLLQAGDAESAGRYFDTAEEYFVDLERRVSQVGHMLAQPDAKKIFIVGLSGIGKSMLAKQVLCKFSPNFTVSCLVSLDNEAHSNGGGQVLRKIKDVLKERHNRSGSLSILEGTKVLMVLDNVESQSQLEELATATWLHGRGSRLIVTTTNSRLGTPSNTFKVPYLSKRESQELFLHYAFEGREQSQDLRSYAEQVIKKCANFPLSLKVLGSFLSKENVRDKQFWVDLIDRLDKALEVDGGHDYRLWARLRPCYDALPEPDKEIFLDVATFFHGFRFSLVEHIWKASRETSHLALMNLKSRFLVEVDADGQIWMHRQIRNLGESIASPRNIAVNKRKRIYESTAAKDLIENHQVTYSAGISKTFQNDALQGSMNSVTRAFKLGVMENERITLTNTTFDHYVQLEYLILEGVEVAGGSVELPRSLVYLRWTCGLFDTCPIDFTNLEKLVALELQDCKALKFLPSTVMRANKLKWLDLEGCLLLTELPTEFSTLRRLEYLGLSRTRIKKLPSNLGKLARLGDLQASDTRLTRVPKSIGNLGMLISLNLSRTCVTVLPESIGNLSFLTSLKLNKTKLSSLPESIGQLLNLKTLKIRHTCVKTLPRSFGKLLKLDRLELGGTPLETLPESFHKLSSLKVLRLDYTQIDTLPEAFGELAKLECLEMEGTPLRRMPESFKKLSQLLCLNAINVGKPFLEALPTFVSTISNSLLRLSLPLWSAEVGGEESDKPGAEMQLQTRILSLLPQLLVLDTLICYDNGNLQTLPSSLFRTLRQMPSLRQLGFWEFKHLETLPVELGTLTTLDLLDIRGCPKLQELPNSLGGLSSLTSLCLVDLLNLRALPECLSALPSLNSLDIFRCKKLRHIPHYFGLVAWCRDLESPTSCVYEDTSCTSDPTLPSLVVFSQLNMIFTDSWSLLECCLGSVLPFHGSVFYLVKCKGMEKLEQKAMEKRRGSSVSLGVMKVVELLRPTFVESQIGDECLRDTCMPSTSNFSRHGCSSHTFTLYVMCGTYALADGNYSACNVHESILRFQDENKSDEDEEKDEDENDESEDDSSENESKDEEGKDKESENESKDEEGKTKRVTTTKKDKDSDGDNGKQRE